VSEDYIGPFGPESIEAGVEADRTLGENGEAVAYVDSVTAVLSAAVGAVDREAAFRTIYVALYADGTGRTYAAVKRDARTAVEALFPTGPEAQDGR
jgi:hypothetical protein